VPVDSFREDEDLYNPIGRGIEKFQLASLEPALRRDAD
jgi:hypothetical protein